MSVKSHYDNHLARFYSWMTGNLADQQDQFGAYLERHGLLPVSTKKAVDLGAGHGIQSIPLARLGYEVTAVDFNEQLLGELRANSIGWNITAVRDDIRNITNYMHLQPELILCCGDTLSHLDAKDEVRQFVEDCAKTLVDGGRLLLSFRDYSVPLTGSARFIPVKSDANRILTCILDYEDKFITVTDQLYERTGDRWEQRISSYRKVRITTGEVMQWMTACGLIIKTSETIKGMIYLIAAKNGPG